MKKYQYQITSFELNAFAGPNIDAHREVTMTAPLGNSGRTLNIGFYGSEVDQLPPNRFVSGIIYVSMRTVNLNWLLQALSKGAVGFQADLDKGTAEFGFAQ